MNEIILSKWNWYCTRRKPHIGQLLPFSTSRVELIRLIGSFQLKMFSYLNTGPTCRVVLCASLGALR